MGSAGHSPPRRPAYGTFLNYNRVEEKINDKVVKLGDIVDGVSIVRIEKDFITVSFANREYKLSSPASGNPFSSSVKQGKKEGFYEN